MVVAKMRGVKWSYEHLKGCVGLRRYLYSTWKPHGDRWERDATSRVRAIVFGSPFCRRKSNDEFSSAI